MNEYNYELKKPFSYANKGDQVDACFITLFPPSFKHIDKVAPIKQAFTAALKDTVTDSSADRKEEPQKEESDDGESLTASQAIQILYGAKADITKVFLHAQELFKFGAALVDGESKLTIPLMEKMDLSDFEGLLGAYLANFIVPSLMDGEESSTG